MYIYICIKNKYIYIFQTIETHAIKQLLKHVHKTNERPSAIVWLFLIQKGSPPIGGQHIQRSAQEPG